MDDHVPACLLLDTENSRRTISERGNKKPSDSSPAEE